MLKISDVIREIINSNELLNFGFQHKLLNLSQVAKFIKPLVETRLKKEVQLSAILMNLSRLQRIMVKTSPVLKDYVLDNMTIHSNLSTYTFEKNKDTHRSINEVHRIVIDKGGYITVTESTNEITLIIDNNYIDLISKKVFAKPKFQQNSLAALGIKFDESYSDVPGLIYFLVEKLNLQGINIIEIASTYTELTFYLKQGDIKLAFDTMYHFLKKPL